MMYDPADVDRERRLRSCERAGGAYIPWLEPAVRFARAGRRRGGAAYRSACALLEGGWWTPWRKYVDGMTEHPTCRCGKAIGCMWHQLSECRHVQAQRQEHGAVDMFLDADTQYWNPLYSRGVALRPCMPPDPIAVHNDFGDEAIPRKVIGRVYTDGSLKGLCRRTLRAGWAFVVFGDGERPLWARCGSVPERHPTTLRSELRAVIEAVRLAEGDITIYTDCAAVIKGHANGRKWSTAASRPAADLWKDFWGAVDAMNGDLHLVKVPAHKGVEDITMGRVKATDWLGNWVADALAKKRARDLPSWSRLLAPSRAR